MQVHRAMLNVKCVELVPTIGRLEYVSLHRLSEARLVFFGACDRGLIAPAASEASVFNPALEFLVPGVRANAI
jgi:hypothetical protein